MITDAGTTTTDYGFAGEEQDPTTEHLYLRARTYNPGNGRFLQQDSVLGSPNQPRTLHRYTYGFNNPVNYTDPSGHMPPAGNNATVSAAGNSSTGAGGNSPSGPGGSSPGRSANGGRPNSNSDHTPKEQSEGFRPSLCGFIQAMQTAIDVANDVAQEVLEWTKPFQDSIDPLQERLYNAVKDTAFIRELQRDAKEHPVESLVATVLLDWVYDLTSVILGHDLMSGQKLSHGEELLSIAAVAIPVLSVAAVKLGPKIMKAGGLLARHGDEFIEGVEFAAKHADELGDAARFATKHSDELADAVTWSARHGDDLGEARLAQRLDDYVARSDDTARLADNMGSLCKGNSFTAGTPVETEDGPKPIEEIQEGDKVLAEDPETGEQGYFEVVALTNHPTDEILRITIAASDDDEASEQEGDETDNGEDDNSAEQEVMEITPDHPVYVEDEGWLLAENLEEGGRLRRADGGIAKVLAIERIQLDEPESVYNFTVRGPHTYFVLDDEVLVHNAPASGSSICALPRRSGLSSYADGGWRYGQLDDEEIKFWEGLAEARGRRGNNTPLLLSGSGAETDLALQRRYNLELQPYLETYRRNKPYSSLVDDANVNGAMLEMDIWAGSKISPDEETLIREFYYSRFSARNPDANIGLEQFNEVFELDTAGYGLNLYPKTSSFETMAGGIAFYPSGYRRRFAAPWQTLDWPPSGATPNLTVDLRDIFYTQDYISSRHRGGFTVQDNIEGLISGKYKPEDFGSPIRVFVKHPLMDDWGPMTVGRFTGDPRNLLDYRIYSLDNRRLYEFKEAGLSSVQVNWLPRLDPIYDTRWHFSTKDFGESIILKP